MGKQLLADPMEKPENDVLKKALGKNYARYMEFVDELKNRNLIVEWNYYNDGKSWLGKVLDKKKNLCWLSVWNNGFRLTFYFTGKTIDGLYELDIDNEIKDTAANSKPTGKLIPVLFLVANKIKMNDGLKILDYKKGLK